MEIKTVNNVADICELVGINYGKETIDAVTEIVKSSNSWEEFNSRFSTYYTENGLGGDDKLGFCTNVFDMLLKPDDILRVGDKILLKGNSGFTYRGIIETVGDDETFEVCIMESKPSRTVTVEKEYIVRKL